jgi:hypothetical protein
MVIRAGKVMLTIVWSPDALRKGGQFNSSSFGQNILCELPPTGTVKPILIHMDNASPHPLKATLAYMKAFNFRPMQHPPVSPDLVSSDFYLFGTIKGRLRGRTFQDARGLLEAISEMTGSIRSIELDAVFCNWED